MPYDPITAQRIREVLGSRTDVVEKKMFGGIAFMVSGHMCCGVVGHEMMARVGPEQYEAALARPGAREMDFTHRPMRGFVFVAPEGIDLEADLENWVALCETYVRSLPPK